MSKQNTHDDKGNVTHLAPDTPPSEPMINPNPQPQPYVGDPPPPKPTPTPPPAPAPAPAPEIEEEITIEELLEEIPVIEVERTNELSYMATITYNGKRTYKWATTINTLRKKAHAWLISQGYPHEDLEIGYKDG